MGYFRSRLNDPELLAALIDIAMEGEDMGDAPWAAANVIEGFPSAMLKQHKTQLRQIAAKPWTYLSDPARRALRKLDPGEAD